MALYAKNSANFGQLRVVAEIENKRNSERAYEMSLQLAKDLSPKKYRRVKRKGRSSLDSMMGDLDKAEGNIKENKKKK